MMTTTGEFTLVRPREIRLTAGGIAMSVALVVGAIAALAQWSEGTESPTLPPGAVASLGPITSHNGRFRARVVELSPSLSTADTEPWVVGITTRMGRRVANAHVRVSASMPEFSNASAASPNVQYVGGGKYRVGGLHFDRAGWWNIALTVRARGRVDSLAFNIIVPAQKGAHEALRQP